MHSRTKYMAQLMKKLETKSMVLLKHHLKALRMPTMHAECEKVAARCAQDNVDHLGFLLQLIELELIDRERRAGQGKPLRAEATISLAAAVSRETTPAARSLPSSTRMASV